MSSKAVILDGVPAIRCGHYRRRAARTDGTAKARPCRRADGRTRHLGAPGASSRRGEADVIALKDIFVPPKAEGVMDFTDLITAAFNVIRECESRACKVNSTTGYKRPILEKWPLAAAVPDFTSDDIVCARVCAGDLAKLRPTKLMMYRGFADLGFYPSSAVVKMDDTAPGIAEGLATGTWTVSVAMRGTSARCALQEWQALAPSEQARMREADGAVLARADNVNDSVADLLPVLVNISRRLVQGFRLNP